MTQLKLSIRVLRIAYHRLVRKRGIQALSFLLHHMPRDSGSFGPPRRSGNASIARAAITEVRPVLAAERLVFDEPLSITPAADFWCLAGASPDLGEFPRTARGARYIDIPPGVVYTLPRARAIGPEGWIVDRDDRLLTDLSPDYIRERYIPSRHPLMNALHLPRASHIAGTVAVLGTLSANGYYGHWMMDLLPRAAMLTKAGFRFEDFDGVYIPAPRNLHLMDMLARMGMAADQIIDATAVPHLRADRLIVPSCYANVFAASSWCCETLRALATPATGSASHHPELLYVSRSGTYSPAHGQ